MRSFLLSLMVFICTPSWADQDKSSDDLANAYQSTQEMLKDQKQRQEVINQSDKAKESDQFVDKVVQGDGKKKDKMYNIASDITGNFSSKSPEEANKILNEASKNPEGFFNSLTPEQQKSIRELANTLEPAKAPAKP